tara:strand:- start:51 stop:362 length:312 start_codon:yes stop_codon:yes gene_type:complete
MDNSTSRFLGRLGVINYEMATHEGTANQRLASKAGEILRLDKSQVPQRHKADFMNLIDHLEKTVEKLPGLMIPVRVKGIYNSSAVKFIRLLWVIESELLELEN